jgi:hypothetical protein
MPVVRTRAPGSLFAVDHCNLEAAHGSGACRGKTRETAAHDDEVEFPHCHILQGRKAEPVPWPHYETVLFGRF